MKNRKSLFLFDKQSRWARYHSTRLKRLRDTPHSIAIGAAIGVFLGVFPTFGIGLFVAIAIAGLINVNKTAAAIGSLVMNPVTTPFFWTISAYIGGYITGTEWEVIYNTIKDTDWKTIIVSIFTNFEIPQNVSSTFGSVVWSYVIGNIIVSVVVTYIVYIIVLSAVRNYQERRNKKLLKAQEKMNR